MRRPSLFARIFAGRPELLGCAIAVVITLIVTILMLLITWFGPMPADTVDALRKV